MSRKGNARRLARAERIYRWVVRSYPTSHRRAFGRQMLDTFRDSYQDAVEAGSEGVLRFWLSVVGDECRSLAREHGAALRTAFREGIAPMKTTLPIVAATVGLLVLLGLRVVLYPALLAAPHGGGTAISSTIAMAVLLVLYAAGALVICNTRSGVGVAERSAALRRATLLGGVVGVGVLAAIAVGTFAGPESSASLGAWGIVVAMAPVVWIVIGWWAARLGGSLRLGVVAALWCGMVSALAGALGEVASTLFALPSLMRNEFSNPDFLYWHPTDAQSYAIASAVAVGLMGLILVPIAATIVGGIGAWLGRAVGLASPRGRAAA